MNTVVSLKIAEENKLHTDWIERSLVLAVRHKHDFKQIE